MHLTKIAQEAGSSQAAARVGLYMLCGAGLYTFQALRSAHICVQPDWAVGFLWCRQPALEEPTDCRLVQVSDTEGQPCSVTVCKTVRGTQYMVVSQLHSVVLKGLVGLRTLQHKLEQLCNRACHPFRTAAPVLRAKLVRLQATSAAGKAPLLTTVPLAARAVQSLQVGQGVVDSLHAIQRGENVVLDHATSDLLAQNAVGSTAPESLPFAPHLPMMIDLEAAPILRARERLSLDIIRPSLASSATLQLQLQNLEEWSKAPLVMTRRGPPVRHTTWLDIVKQIMLFLGFLFKVFKVAHPNLEHFTRADFVAAWVAAKAKRGDRGGSISKGVYVAMRVCEYWRHKVPSEAHRLTELLAWMAKMPAKLLSTFPSSKRKIQDLQSQGKWSSARSLVMLFASKKSEVETAFQGVVNLTCEQARKLHDVCLACVMFGWLPCPRSMCIRTLCSTEHKGPCTNPDCHDDQCQGNRLVKLAQHGRLGMVLAHHKAQIKWGVIELDLDAELSSLLRLYLSQGLKVLRRDLEVQDHPYIFMSMSGRAFHHDSFCIYWKNLMCEWGGPVCGPHTLRHIFVDTVMQGNSHIQPNTLGSAYCMGHDPSQWYHSYDLEACKRSGQRAITAMGPWRAALLAESPEQPSTSQQPPHDSMVEAARSDPDSYHDCEEDISVEQGDEWGSNPSDTSVDDIDMELSDEDD